MTKTEWLASRVDGRDIECDDYVQHKLEEMIHRVPRAYGAANGWTVLRAPGVSKGAWNWIAFRLAADGVRLRGFDQLKHAKTWCLDAHLDVEAQITSTILHNGVCDD